MLSSMCLYIYIPYTTYYKPMGNLPYISSEQGGGLIIHIGLYTNNLIISVLYLYQNFELKVGLYMTFDAN